MSSISSSVYSAEQAKTSTFTSFSGIQMENINASAANAQAEPVANFLILDILEAADTARISAFSKKPSGTV